MERLNEKMMAGCLQARVGRRDRDENDEKKVEIDDHKDPESECELKECVEDSELI